ACRTEQVAHQCSGGGKRCNTPLRIAVENAASHIGRNSVRYGRRSEPALANSSFTDQRNGTAPAAPFRQPFTNRREFFEPIHDRILITAGYIIMRDIVG